MPWAFRSPVDGGFWTTIGIRRDLLLNPQRIAGPRTHPREITPGPIIARFYTAECRRVANPQRRADLYGHAGHPHPGLLDRGHGPPPPRGRQPLRGGLRRAAGDPRTAA